MNVTNQSGQTTLLAVLVSAWALLATTCAPSADSFPSATDAGLPTKVPTTAVPAPPDVALTVPRLRRLGNTEIANVLTEISGEPLGHTRAFTESLLGSFLPDPRSQGYDNDATTLVVSESKLEELGMVAERIAAQLTRPERLGEVAPCDRGSASSDSQLACARSFITRLAAEAWGRPADNDETAALLQAFTTHAGGGKYGAGIAVIAEAMLMSPNFVYRAELGRPTSPTGDRRLTGLETASAISFLARGARPDSALLAAGMAGELDDPAQRRAHTTRLLDSPAGRQQMERFIRSWLGLDDVAAINKDLAIYPGFTPSVRRCLDKEVTTFLDHVFRNEGGRLEALFFADYSFPGSALGEIYGQDLLGPIGDFTQVRLDPKRRRGLLASPAFLARHALINQTNPVERGLLIRTRLFCQDVPPPPPDVAANTPEGGPETTTRKKYEAHLTQPLCNGCHKLIDPLGFGLEQFDAIGRYRTKEGDHDVDARGEIVGTDVDGDFSGPVALAERLLRSAQFRRCVAEQAYRFAHGRAIESGDRSEIAHLAHLFDRSEDRLPALFAEIAARPTFVLRKPLASAEAP
ncbi:MAG TPA: DUF1588 domain-containing protein [Polyangia bacterium]